MNLAPAVAGMLLSSAQLQAEDFQNAALRQLAALSEAGVDIYISGGYAKWKRRAEKDFVGVAESGSALLDDYIELGFVPIKPGPPDGID